MADLILYLFADFVRLADVDFAIDGDWECEGNDIS
jgi:hypothetical protein